MNGQFVRLTPAPEMELHENGKPFAQFDPKTVYLVEGADPIVLGRASSRDTKRINDPDNGYLKIPTGQTALGREHALLCLRSSKLYIAMKERDGMIMDAMSAHPRFCSEYYPVLNGSRVRLGVNGAPSVNFLVDVVFEISDSDRWSASTDKQFIKQLPL
ncbi:hypothetical protein DFH08DRAFT_1089867 [Mycena albidolilacea]|uniref:Uncharacterized protein n=1 Tax=Mycena albidolilacea TaxID=1033008 RepID=A0AAD7E7U4_9AGAR|nr:hypothetical protein DFH08DRAFT_1089867 [Mycena albidolilacea]